VLAGKQWRRRWSASGCGQVRRRWTHECGAGLTGVRVGSARRGLCGRRVCSGHRGRVGRGTCRSLPRALFVAQTDDLGARQAYRRLRQPVVLAAAAVPVTADVLLALDSALPPPYSTGDPTCVPRPPCMHAQP
jgi:hypothetical protein